jgi:hypothetical protein
LHLFTTNKKFMIKKITFTLLLTYLFFNSQTSKSQDIVFGWETATTSGSPAITTETINGVTVSFEGEFVNAGPTPGINGVTSNNVIVPAADVNSPLAYTNPVKFTFNKPVNIKTINTLNLDSQQASADYIFSTFDGGNVDRTVKIEPEVGVKAILNWNNVIEFTVTTTGFGVFVFDNLIVTPIPTLNNEEFGSLNEINTYPNPVSDILNIKNVFNIENILLYSPLGQLILETNSQTIDFSKYQSGIYTLKIHTDKGVAIRKIVKK